MNTIRPFTQKELDDRFGLIEYEIVSGGNGRIRITNDWERENLVIAIIPQLVGIKAAHGLMRDRLYCHKEMVPIYKSVFNDFEKHGVLEDILFFGGCFSRRLIRGSDDELTSHCYTISLDFNPQWNRLGCNPVGPGEKGSNHRLTPIMVAHNFIWGRDFSRIDSMHYQLGFVEASIIHPETEKQRAIRIAREQLDILEREEN